MYFLQAVVETETDWTGPTLYSLGLVVVLYAVALLVIYFVIRAAVRSGTLELRKESKIANRLRAEDLKIKGLSDQRLKEILGSDT